MAYAQHYEEYYNKGWAPFPLPAGKKFPPPTGATGDNPYPSVHVLDTWARSREPIEDDRNIGIRMPEFVVGIDVDALDGKQGAQTLRDLMAELGLLPVTYRSSAAMATGSVHGIHFYQVPPRYDPDTFRDPGLHIEVIRPSHRYAVAPPSMHPRGVQYQWYYGHVATTVIPRANELPYLPDSWCEYLSSLGRKRPQRDGDTSEVTYRPTTQQQLTDAVIGHLEAIRTAEDGTINNTLAEAAFELARVAKSDVGWAWSDLVWRIHDALTYTVYDGRTWDARTTIDAAYREKHWWLWTYQDEFPFDPYEPGDEVEQEESLWPQVRMSDVYHDETVDVPTVGMEMPHGGHMLYAGKEHSIAGETESGKSWIAVMHCLAEMRKGHNVIYVHFEESSHVPTLLRFKLLGMTEAEADFLTFVAPRGPYRPRDMESLQALRPSLVVLDGINEAYSLFGAEIASAEDTAAMRRKITKPFTEVGAATLGLDHVAKNATTGRYAFGSVHKANSLDGASFLLRNDEPMGRGRNGSSRLLVAKDRPGHLRQHGMAYDGSTLLATIHVQSSEEAFSAYWAGPTPLDGLREDVVLGVKAFLFERGPSKLAAIRKGVTGSYERIGEAVKTLVAEGLVSRSYDGTYTLIIDGE